MCPGHREKALQLLPCMQGEVSKGKITKSNGLYDEMPYESASASEEDEASEPEYDDDDDASEPESDSEDEASDADGAAAGKFV